MCAKRKALRIAVVGLGRIGWQFHCPEIAKHKEYELVAVGDNNAERCQEARDQYGCEAFTDYTELLDTARPDIVTLATPTHLHKAMCAEAFRRGIHVFLEKPMALNVKEARAILRAAKKAGVLLTIYQPHRTMAAYQQIRKILESGIIGDLCHIRRGAFNYARRNDWQSLRKYGGGMLYNYGAHYFDQMLSITGFDVKRLFCQTRLVATLGDAEDAVKIVYETKSGILGEVDINQAAGMSPYELEAFGTHGAVMLKGGEITIRWFDPKKLPPKTLIKRLEAEGRAYPSDQIPFESKTVPVDGSLAVNVYSNLASAIRKGTPLLVPPEETVLVMKYLDQCAQQAGRGADHRIFKSA